MILILISMLALNSCSGSYWTEGNESEANKKISASEPDKNDFLSWCYDLDDQPAQRTVQAMLALTKETDCELGVLELFKLKTIDLSEQGLSKVEPLASLSSLENLYLGENQIADLSSLADLAALRVLVISNNLVTSLSELTGLENLKYLLAGGNHIEDESPLSLFEMLETAWLGIGEKIKAVSLGYEPLVSVEKGEGPTLECAAGYSYFPYKSCRDASHPVESYKKAQTPACGVASRTPVYKACRTSANGLEGRKEEKKESFIQPYNNGGINIGVGKDSEARCERFYTSLASSEYLITKALRSYVNNRASDSAASISSVKIECIATLDWYRSAPNPACEVDHEDLTYNLCADPSHGVESYQLMASAVCGQEETLKLGDKNLGKEDYNNLGAISGCQSCDDLTVSGSEDAEKKAKCLIENSLLLPSRELGATRADFVERDLSLLSEETATEVLRLKIPE